MGVRRHDVILAGIVVCNSHFQMKVNVWNMSTVCCSVPTLTQVMGRCSAFSFLQICAESLSYLIKEGPRANLIRLFRGMCIW